MKNKEQKIVVMTGEELDNLIYFACLRASKRANDSLFNGLFQSYLEKLLTDSEAIVEALDQVLTILRTSPSKEETESDPIEEEKPHRPLSNALTMFDKLSDEEKVKLREKLQPIPNTISDEMWRRMQLPYIPKE